MPLYLIRRPNNSAVAEPLRNSAGLHSALINAAELAEKLVGPETKAVQDAIASIRNAAQRAIMRNREFEQRRVNPIDRVKMALNNKDQ